MLPHKPYINLLHPITFTHAIHNCILERALLDTIPVVQH